jgi:hypothetical protein
VTQCSQPLNHFLSHLIDVFRPGEPSIDGQPKITDSIVPLDCLPEESKRSGFGDASSVLNEEHCLALRYNNDDPKFTQLPFQVTNICFQVLHDQRRSKGRGNDVRVLCVESELDLVGR